MSEQYPALLVISRPPTEQTPEPFVLVDDRTLSDAAEAAERIRLYQMWERANRVLGLYSYTLAPVAEAEAVAEQIRAELEPPSPLDQALELARAAFAGDAETLARLDKAAELVKSGAVVDLGGGQWQVTGGQVYHVNGACQCKDYTHNGRIWCKHRLAVALTKRAAELANKNGAESAANTSAPESPKGDHAQQNYTPTLDLAQVKTIRPIWGADGADLEYLDGRRERRPDLVYRQVETQAQAAGWRGSDGGRLYLTPAIDWQAQTAASQAAWLQAHPMIG